jgi:hypothetical protein
MTTLSKDVSQYSVTLEKLLRVLIIEYGIKEGYWTLGFEFGFAASMLGPDKPSSRPAAIAQVNRVILTRYTGPESDLPPLTIDASTVKRK